MFDQNSSKEEQQQYKKKKEWNAIKNCIPLINECLQLNIDPETCGNHSIFRLDTHVP